MESLSVSTPVDWWASLLPHQIDNAINAYINVLYLTGSGALVKVDLVPNFGVLSDYNVTIDNKEMTPADSKYSFTLRLGTLDPKIIEEANTPEVVVLHVSGHIDDENGSPVPSVNITTDLGDSTTSDLMGYYHLDIHATPNTSVTITYSKKDYDTYTKKISDISKVGQSVTYNVTLKKEKEKPKTYEFPIQGHVRTKEGSSIPDVNVVANDGNGNDKTTTDSSGYYKLTVHTSKVTDIGVYVTYSAAAYKTVTKYYFASRLPSTMAGDVTMESNVAPKPQPTAILSGTVTDLNTGKPIVGVNVIISPINKTITTDSNGHWSISPLYRGQSLTCTVSAQGYKPFTHKITLSNTTDTNILNVKLSHVTVVQHPNIINYSENPNPNITNYAKNPSNQLDYRYQGTNSQSKRDNTKYWIIGGVVAAGLIAYLIAKKGK